MTDPYLWYREVPAVSLTAHDTPDAYLEAVRHRPLDETWIIGDRTCGKPVGQYSTPFCNKVLAAVSFTPRNADGRGDFFEGLQPNCRAVDDVEHLLGDPLEGSLREALAVIATGQCSPAVAAAPASPRRVPASAGQTGWQALVGAH